MSKLKYLLLFFLASCAMKMEVLDIEKSGIKKHYIGCEYIDKKLNQIIKEVKQDGDENRVFKRNVSLHYREEPLCKREIEGNKIKWLQGFVFKYYVDGLIELHEAGNRTKLLKYAENNEALEKINRLIKLLRIGAEKYCLSENKKNYFSKKWNSFQCINKKRYEEIIRGKTEEEREEIILKQLILWMMSRHAYAAKYGDYEP